MAKKKSTAPATSATAEKVGVDAAVDAGEYGEHYIAQIRISYTNRTRFDEVRLQELAASIKSMGIIQPIVIRPVTPTATAPELFEIVAGERRYRASIIAGLATIPAICRQLSDEQAAEIQLLENIQREDPHEIEEAEGYERLMLNFGWTADALAEKVKKSKSYIYARLKLCALTLDVRDKFFDKAIPASTALLLARIPVPNLQTRALNEILRPTGFPPEPMSVRRAQQHIHDNYTLDLTTANFEMDDAKLLAVAGSCTKCPKRSGNQPIIFADIKSADVCTDPDCFAEKRAAQYAKVIVIANKSGIPVLEDDEADEAMPDYWDDGSEYVVARSRLSGFERNAPETKNEGSVFDHLGKENMPKPSVYAKQDDGTVVELFRRDEVQAALEKLGACETVAQHAERMGIVSDGLTDADREAARRVKDQEKKTKHEEEAQALTAERVALYKRVRARAADGFSLGSLREFTKGVLDNYCLPTDLLTDVYDFDTTSDESIAAHIDQAPHDEVQLLLVDLFLGERLKVELYEVAYNRIDDSAFDVIRRMAACEGIDADAHDDAGPTQDFAPISSPAEEFGNLTPGTIAQFVNDHPELINDLSEYALENKPLFIAPLELAANALGYFYGQGGFAKRINDEVEPADEATPDDGDYVDPAEFAPAPTTAPAKVASKKAKSKPVTEPAGRPVEPPVLSPAAAWPFPKFASATTEKDQA